MHKIPRARQAWIGKAKGPSPEVTKGPNMLHFEREGLSCHFTFILQFTVPCSLCRTQWKLQLKGS